MKKARFITFEGIEGCGKSTQLRLLAERLTEDGHSLVVTREPGGCPLADKVRAILLDAENSEMVPLTELLLYAAARAQHVAEVIAPALKASRLVLCDRYTDATFAYQGIARRLNLDEVRYLNRLATGDLSPDLTILFDCPVEVGLSRALARISGLSGTKEERFEQESLEFHQRVRDGYLELASSEPNRYVVMDAAREVATIAEDVAAVVLKHIQRSSSHV